MTSAGASGLLDFVWSSPSPFHCVETAASALLRAGFAEVDEGGPPVGIEPGQGAFIRRGGSLMAWRAGTDAPAAAGFRILGAHTDSPNLRVKPRPDCGNEGYRKLGLEIYGGVLLSTWMDRDLGLSGKVMLRGEQGGVEGRLFRCDRPIARIANLAIHLNRGVNTDGLKLDPQKHMPALLGLGDGPEFRVWLAGELGLPPEQLLSWELGLHDLQQPTLGGIHQEFVFSPRMDNQFCSYTALMALIAAEPGRATQVLALFDHEEIGSRTYRGASGPWLRDVLSRLVRDHAERAPGGLERAVTHSLMVSGDMAHGVHPNYADLHEPLHKPRLNGGPVLKSHAEHRYATEAESAAFFRVVCADIGVPCQDFVTRTDLACGSTIGPISAAELGIRTVDIGCAQLSMHSVREQAGADDVAMLSAAMRRALETA